MKAPWWDVLKRHWAERVLELRNNLHSGPPLPPVTDRASTHDHPPIMSHSEGMPPLASVSFTPRREAEPAAAEPPCRKYAVQTGDCLYGISRQFGVDVKTLLASNPHLSNPDSLPLGFTLSVPLPFTPGVPNSSKLARISLPPPTPLPRPARPQLNSAKVLPRSPQQGGAARALQMRVAAIAFAVYGKLLLGGGSGGVHQYTVVRGDTLAKIAARHKTTVAAIKQANKLKNDVIIPGRTLALPSSARPATLQKASLAEREAAMYGLRQQSKEILAPISPNPVFQAHAPQRRVVVRPGDTLSEIATTHRITVQELMRLNNLKGYGICAGDILALSPAPRTPVESIRKGPRRSRMYLFSRDWHVCTAQRKPGVGGGIVKQARWKQRKTKPFNDCWRFNCPLQSGFISSPYGPRKLAGQRRSIHYGVDIAADTGTPILAADRGVIAKVAHHFWDTDGYGNYVDIMHSGNFLTRYAHCQSLLVREGQRVSRGQEIATVGATGNAQGPHLHFEVRKEGKTVNPAHYTRLC